MAEIFREHLVGRIVSFHTNNFMSETFKITEYCNFKCPYCRGLNDEIYKDRKFKQLIL
jgi:sulfatase maturation enzyme AslB (radical SAM superfamily)